MGLVRQSQRDESTYTHARENVFKGTSTHTRTGYTGLVDSTEHGSQLRLADFEKIELLHKAKGLAWHGKTSTAI